ncbi:MAG: SDR family oxidoreductase [Pseudomonadota bacterium]
MNKIAFITGFPGFLARFLLEKMQKQNSFDEYFCLVQDAFIQKAKDIINSNGYKNVKIYKGDITKPNLDLCPEDYEKLTDHSQYCFHLAAIYDLKVKKEFAKKINVLGTKNIINFIKDCKDFKRFNYISTCYVAGNKIGIIKEEDLEHNEGFKNFYESTKYEAEILVSKEMKNIPTTIYRPSIVTGDTKEGKIEKVDGIYFIIRLLKKLHGLPMVDFGKGKAYFNLVPVDWVVDSIIKIQNSSETTGLTFALADPRPIKSRDLINLICKKLNYPKLGITIPPSLFYFILKIPFIEKYFGIPKESLIYINHNAFFDSKNTQKFADPCPGLIDYLDVLIKGGYDKV